MGHCATPDTSLALLLSHWCYEDSGDSRLRQKLIRFICCMNVFCLIIIWPWVSFSGQQTSLLQRACSQRGRIKVETKAELVKMEMWSCISVSACSEMDILCYMNLPCRLWHLRAKTNLSLDCTIKIICFHLASLFHKRLASLFIWV